ncbi:MAG: hypothetical protein ABSD44_04195 [Terracidiphilus sp.]
MPKTTRNSHQGKGRPRRLESHAFYLGAHNVDPTPVLDEIEARFAHDTSEERQEPLRALHDLEAKLQQARKEKPEAEALWMRIRKELGDTPPPYFQAMVMALCAFFALALDTLFLAPTMDILNIADPVLQYLAAAGFSLLCTIYFELTGILYIRGRSWPRRLTAVAVGCLGVVSLTVWGLLRGYQLRFAAALAGNPLGQLLGEHPMLASVFFIFITLATPAIGATALLYGWEEMSRAWTWRAVRGRFEKLRAAEIKLARDVQTETEHLGEFDKRKQAQCREWRAIFQQFYERGAKNGAVRETRWSVIRKAGLGVLLASPLALPIPFFLFPAHILVPAVAGFATFIYCNRRRHHPDHECYLAQEHTHFKVIPDAPQPRELLAPEQRLLPKGDNSKGDNQ